jgi:hypothetical protein
MTIAYHAQSSSTQTDKITAKQTEHFCEPIILLGTGTLEN